MVPDELLVDIFGRLTDPKDIVSVSRTCRLGYRLAFDRYSLRGVEVGSVLDEACKRGIWWVIKAAIGHGFKDQCLVDTTRYGHLEIVQLLLDHGADIHAQDDDPICWASRYGHLEIVQLLLDHGADVHACDDYPLRWASYNGHLEIVQLLLDHGANVHARDDYSLRWASANGHTTIVELLRSRP